MRQRSRMFPEEVASGEDPDRSYGAETVNLRAFFAVTLLLAGLVASPALAASNGTETRHCAAPLGPGDKMRHSVGLMVANIDCATGSRRNDFRVDAA